MIPPKRLKYEKYNGCDNVIIIDLYNGYSVIAIWSQNEQEFLVTLHLKENTINKWSLIPDDNHDVLTFYANRNTINSAILKQVSTYLNEGFFDYFIERDKYELRCVELGCNLLDEERLGDI